MKERYQTNSDSVDKTRIYKNCHHYIQKKGVLTLPRSDCDGGLYWLI